jgi:hypothetical protein
LSGNIQGRPDILFPGLPATCPGDGVFKFFGRFRDGRLHACFAPCPSHSAFFQSPIFWATGSQRMASGNFPGGSGRGPLLSASLKPGKLWLRLKILDNLPSPKSFIWFLLLGRSLFALGVRISKPPARNVASHAHSLRKLKGSCCLGEWSPRLAAAFGRGCLPPALGQVYCAIGPLQRPRIWLTPDMGETQAGIR